MKFSYTVSTKTGKIERGVLDASSRDDAEKILREGGFFVILVEPKSAASRVGSFRFPILGSISVLDKIFFARHLALLIHSGISLHEALLIIKDEVGSGRMQRIVDDVIRDVGGGLKFSTALAKHKANFSPLFIHVVGVGEASGRLEENLDYIASTLEKEYNLKKRFVAAMLYPVIILSLAFFIAGGMVIFVLPKFIPLLESLEVELPLSTRFLLFVAKLSDQYGIQGAGIFFGGAVVLRLLLRVPFIHYLVARVLLRLPIFGKLSKHMNLVLFARNFGTLLKSGISANEALAVSAKATANPVYRERIISLQKTMESGESLGKILSEEKNLFPLVFGRMIAVGEKSGNLDETLDYLAAFYEREVDSLTADLSNILQPILLIFVGFLVLFIALSIITPIYRFTESIHP